MCEHEFVEAQGTKMDYEKNDNGRIETLIRRKVCWKCYKTKTEIDLEQQLAAANTNNKALREENELLRHKSAGHEETMLRAELVAANAKIDEREIYWETHYLLITKSTAEQLAAANARVVELEADRIVTCVYCGHEYPTGTPTSQNKLLTEHIKVCGKRPMRFAEKQLELTRQQRDAIFEKLEQAEAQNKRMRELLIEIKSYAETYVDLNPRMKHIIDCAKAALEDKA